MSEHQVMLIILSTDDLDESIRFYGETLGMSEVSRRRPLRRSRRRPGHPCSRDRGGPPHPRAGGRRDQDRRRRRRGQGRRGQRRRHHAGPYDDARERRAVVYDNKGNEIVFYKPLGR